MPIHPIGVVERVIDEYRRHLLTEFRARDPRLRAALAAALEGQGFLAQDPFFQAYSPFKEGRAWADLGLDQRLAGVLEKRSGSHTFLHQSDAILHLRGESPSHLAVTTGTGSGKTECFLVPVLQNAIEDYARYSRDGLTAILVYPMNALASDQEKRIDEYLAGSGHTGIRVARYDRSTSQQKRDELRARPPHILLTNYMMLEYLLVRPKDRDAIFKNHRCRYLVLDEVHTYRGSLGTNIALLFRRLREHLAKAQHDFAVDVKDGIEKERRFPKPLIVATSATIKSIDETNRTPEERRVLRETAVQEFLAVLTGELPQTFKVLGEERRSLETPAEARWPAQPVVVDPPALGDPDATRRVVAALAGLPEGASVGEAVRGAKILWYLADSLAGKPMSLSALADAVLADIPERKGAPRSDVLAELHAALFAGCQLGELPGALRIRAHRFLRGGWRFHRCVDPACGKLYARGEDTCTCGKKAAPLLICRSCGADALHVRGPEEPSGAILSPYSAADDEGIEWVLYDQRGLTGEQQEDEETESDIAGPEEVRRTRTQKSRQKVKGRKVLHGSFDPDSRSFDGDENVYAVKVLMAAGRNRCLACGGFAGSGSVLTAVALGTSAAVRVLAEGVVESLSEQHRVDPEYQIDPKERVLIFADSRQDAAHQAQFIQEAGRYDRMRRRLVRALEERGALTIEDAVTELLVRAFAVKDSPPLAGARERSVDVLGEGKRHEAMAWEEAPLLDDLAVRAVFRASVINLGLVGVRYGELERAAETFGRELSASLRLTSAQLVYLCRCLLDEMRTRGALSRPMLTHHPLNPSYRSPFRKAEWDRRFVQPQGYPCDSAGNPRGHLDKSEIAPGVTCNNAWRKPGKGGGTPRLQRVFSHLLRRMAKLDADERMLLDVMRFLQEAGVVEVVKLFGYSSNKPTPLLMVNAGSVKLVALKADDRMRCSVCNQKMPWAVEGAPCRACHGELRPWGLADVEESRYFQRIRRPDEIPLIAEEHTAQLAAEKRAEVEDHFNAKASESPLNVLACSPTLEMGIDVRGLEGVVMRNVPPRPDNYAQRGGRAGRRSRSGVVLGYARNTPHDQYFYEKPAEMIAGAVTTPGIALGNRDVVVRHLNAIALGSSSPGLGGRMEEYLTVQGELQEEAIDALVKGFEAQFEEAADLALSAWKDEVLAPLGLSSKGALLDELRKQPARIRDLFDRVRRQIKELRQQVERYAENLGDERAAIRAGEHIRRLLGRSSRGRSGSESDDRTSGHPMRRFAEFGILPGYEFPSEPSTLRLLGDEHEEEPIQVERRFGLAQYQPDAIVHARGHKWRVTGIDRSSPWNPEGDTPWRYVICGTCGLRIDAQGEPTCPRCKGSDLTGRALPAQELAGFVAKRDDSPVIDEEERISRAGAVRCQPQWSGELLSAYLLANDWQAEVRRGEEVRWINESRRRGQRGTEDHGPGFSLCVSCGEMLTIEEEEPKKKAPVNKAPRKGDAPDPYGHARDCPKRGVKPEPFALTTKTFATTLRILVDLPRSFQKDDYERFGLSLGFALRTGMRQLYMLDGPEIEFELEPLFTFRDDAGERQRGSLTFIDPAVGGSGFLERAAAELHKVAERAIEHLNHADCEDACYHCLKSYQNQRFHHLLSWPHALPALEAIQRKNPVRRTERGSDRARVRAWLDAYDAGVGSPLELRLLRMFEARGITVEKQYGIAVESGRDPITYADFAIPDKRLAIYVDGAGFHVGKNLRRDRIIRTRLRGAEPPWRVEEITAIDLAHGLPALADLFGAFPKEAPEPRSEPIPEPVSEPAMHMVLAEAVPEEERYFGDYELLAPLAPGGMAEVFKARHRTTGDIVFIKRVRTDSRDADCLSRELDVYHKLQWHPGEHVLQVLGFERQGEYTALVTELADGGDLAGYVKKKPSGRLDPKEALEIAMAVAAGLAELHRANIVHRDIKPQNVLLSGGHWKIADFGIAKNRDRYGGDKTFQQLGTTGYAAPEQMHGVEAHPSADVYSLGKLFAFLVTGTPLLDSVPKDLSVWRDIIRRMICEEVDKRLSTEEVQAALMSMI
ncbi:MAG: protein kinase [Polyangiaceae bacterium]|nr:protein kinase [Polyangiaceae bacterium]